MKIYLDGSYQPSINSEIAGFSFYVPGDGVYYGIGANRGMRNVDGEIYAALKALDYCIENKIKKVTFVVDYIGLSHWVSGEWTARKEFTIKYRDYMKENTSKHGIFLSYQIVKGHNGEEGNEIADVYAVKSIREFQKSGADFSYKSLAESQEKERTPIYDVVSIDFDGTIVEDDFPNIGKLKPDAKRVINELHESGVGILINTSRVDKMEEEAIAFLVENGILFDVVNETHPKVFEKYGNNPRKVFADVYIDDRNLGGPPIIWKNLEKLLYH